MERDNPKLIRALKDGKAPLEYLVLSVLEGDAHVHKGGADKYGVRNWLRDRIKASTYEGAILRHFKAWAEGEDEDPESGHSHLYHIRACCAILLDSEAHGTLIDDRNRCESVNNRKEENAFGKADFEFPRQHAQAHRTVAHEQLLDAVAAHVSHTPTMKEIIDMENAPVDGPWDVVFLDKDAEGLLLRETRRGPYETVAQAEDYMERNPERITGCSAIQLAKVEIRS